MSKEWALRNCALVLISGENQFRVDAAKAWKHSLVLRHIIDTYELPLSGTRIGEAPQHPLTICAKLANNDWPLDPDVLRRCLLWLEFQQMPVPKIPTVITLQFRLNVLRGLGILRASEKILKRAAHGELEYLITDSEHSVDPLFEAAVVMFTELAPCIANEFRHRIHWGATGAIEHLSSHPSLRYLPPAEVVNFTKMGPDSGRLMFVSRYLQQRGDRQTAMELWHLMDGEILLKNSLVWLLLIDMLPTSGTSQNFDEDAVLLRIGAALEDISHTPHFERDWLLLPPSARARVLRYIPSPQLYDRLAAFDSLSAAAGAAAAAGPVEGIVGPDGKGGGVCARLLMPMLGRIFALGATNSQARGSGA